MDFGTRAKPKNEGKNRHTCFAFFLFTTTHPLPPNLTLTMPILTTLVEVRVRASPRERVGGAGRRVCAWREPKKGARSASAPRLKPSLLLPQGHHGHPAASACRLLRGRPFRSVLDQPAADSVRFLAGRGGVEKVCAVCRPLPSPKPALTSLPVPPLDPHSLGWIPGETVWGLALLDWDCEKKTF